MIRSGVGGPITIIRNRSAVPVTSPPPEGGKPTQNKPQKKINHCIFCLRQFKPRSLFSSYRRKHGVGGVDQLEEETELEKQLESVPKAEEWWSVDLEALVTSFNMLLPFIHQDWRRESEDGLDLGRILDRMEPPQKFPHVPDMCRFCGDYFHTFHRLVSQLTEVVEKIRTVIGESREGGLHSWRRTLLEEHLNSKEAQLHKSYVQAVLQFLDGFGKVREKVAEVPVDVKMEEEETTYIKQETEIGHEGDDDNDMFYASMASPGTFFDENTIKDEQLSQSQSAGMSSGVKRKCRRKKVDFTMKSKSKVKSPRVSKSRALKATKKSKSVRKCDFCPESPKCSQMSEHLRQHIGDYVCPCPNPKCFLAFASPFKLEKLHLQKASKCCKYVKPLCTCKINQFQRCTCEWLKTCDTCAFATSSTHNFRAHLLEHEVSTEKKFTCPLPDCNQGFTQRQSVQCHLDRHSSSYQNCSECETSFRVGTEMETHLKECHGVNEIICCRSCNFQFGSWETLVKHLWTHREDPKSLTCYICNDGVQYFKHSLLEHHFISVHQLGNLLQCEHCALTFLSDRGLRQHTHRKHAEFVEKPIRCDICGGGFANMKSLKTHSQTMHGNVTSSREIYTCNFPNCSRHFNSKYSLKRHKFVNHGSYSGTYKCNVDGCDKSFNLRSLLQSHKLSQHGTEGCEVVRPICEICAESFSSQRSLRRHKLIHGQEKRYQCSICGQQFRYNDVMKRHMRGHETKGDNFKPNGPMKRNRKRIERKLK